jgi:hypothetical protein
MTATTTLDRPELARVTRAPVGLRDVLRSEWIKLRSVRSTFWTAVAATVIAIGVGDLLCLYFSANWSHLSAAQRRTFDPTATSLGGIFFAQIAIGTLGVLVVTSEYGTGMIRTTFAAVPQRRLLLAAKALTFAGMAFLLGEMLSFTAFGIGQAILGPKHLGASLRDTDVLRAVIGGGIYLTLVGLLGMALGALIRRTAGGLATLFGLLFLAMLIASTLPASWYDRIGQYLPASAGSQIMFVEPLDQHVLGPWSGVGVLALYVTAVFGPAAYLVGRRDA